MPWGVSYYEEEDDTIPVRDFIASLPKKHIAKALWEIQLLATFGTSLRMPYTESIKGERYKGLWELRIQQGSDISRIFYYLSVENTFILLHGFLKKTQRTPTQEPETALHYKEDYVRRFGQ
jgi:phage-related protein